MQINFVQNMSDPEFKDLIIDLYKTEMISLDTEATGLDPLESDWLLLQLKLGDTIYVLDVEHLKIDVITYLIGLIIGSDKLVVAFNAKFDVKLILAKTGLLITHVFDPMLAEIILTMGVGMQYYSLVDIVLQYTGEIIDKDIRETFYKENFLAITQEQVLYSARDVQYLEIIGEAQLAKLDKENMRQVAKLEMELVPVVASMELEGIRLDADRWKSIYERNVIEVERLEAELKGLCIDYVLALDWDCTLNIFNKLKIPVKTKKFTAELEGVPLENAREYLLKYYNMNSPAQLKALLYTIGIKTTDTNEKTLNKIDHPLINKIIEYRGQNKLVTSFGEKFLARVSARTGKIHCEYDQLGTVTGRFASKNPNLQNIVQGAEYRSCFIAEPEFKMITADYSQAELRLLGDVSGEPKFIEAYAKGLDLHAMTAMEMFDISRVEDVPKDKRKKAKNINFATVYGSGAYGLYRNFGIPQDEGELYLKKHVIIYPVLHNFMDVAGKEIIKRGYSITPFGRKRYFHRPTIFDSPKELKKWIASTKREGCNQIIQGGSADQTKIALKNMFYTNPFGKDKFKILMQVHDEIVVMVAEECVADAIIFVRDTMNNAANSLMRYVKSECEVNVDVCWSK
jgi:DNA polymerase I